MDVEGRACSARSERADCDAEGTWHPVLPQSFLYNNKPLLAQKGSAAPPSPAMPSASNQDARAVWARRGTAWRLVVLWSAHPCGMTRKVKCLSESFKLLKRRTNVLKAHAFFLTRGHFPRAAGAGPAVRCKRRVLLCGTLPCLAWHRRRTVPRRARFVLCLSCVCCMPDVRSPTHSLCGTEQPQSRLPLPIAPSARKKSRPPELRRESASHTSS